MSGDDYQHVFTLMHAVRLLKEDIWGLTRVRMEVGDAGNVDDLIVEYRDKPALYHQVKFSRIAGEPLDHEWFTNPAGAKLSPLQRFSDSFKKLTLDKNPPRMALVTNRTATPGDPILQHIEGRDGRLMPRLAVVAKGSASGQVRAAWAHHLQISDGQLLEMLDHLEIHTGMGTLEVLRDRCAEAMLAAGLRGDFEAVTLGHSAIRELIEQGCDELDAGAMREVVGRLKLAADQSTASLLVQAIDRFPYPASANVALDWVDYYEGAEPRVRRRLKHPESAVKEMREDLRAARGSINSAGYDRVHVTGAFRLDTAFAIGAEFSDTAGYELLIKQGGDVWETDGEPAEFATTTETNLVGYGIDLAVCLSISHNIAGDVLDHIKDAEPPVKQLVVIAPASGVGRHSIGSARHARGAAQATLDIVRSMSRGAGRIHLFQAAPNALAVMLGHVWNRLPNTQVYADSSPGYDATFEILG